MALIFKNDDYNNILNEVQNNNNVNNNNICDICRDPLLIDTINLCCKHRYHSFCIKETFVKYQAKKCPLCSELILWDSFKTKCIIKKKDGNICNRVCYNDERMCTLHINSYLRSLKKAKKKNESSINDNKTKLENKIKQFKKLKRQIKKLEDEINNLKLSITAEKVDIV